MIAVVDYGMGNRRSVEKALEHVGATALITRDHDEIRSADGIVLPGVGAFPRAMDNLREFGLEDVLCERAGAGVPLLGICLGMQLLFDASAEHGGEGVGLGLLGGDVAYLDTAGERLPHIGWNLVTLVRESRLTAGLGGGAAFYHVHSLACVPAEASDVVGIAAYGTVFASIVERDNVFGAQFHPEKSSRDGLRLLENFVGICARVPA